jgi:lipopolysaccharide export system protein LptC
MQRLRDAWDRFLLYVPLTVMVVLALGTYWLVRSTIVVTDPVAQRPPSHEPDYFMRGFSIRNFDASGRLRTEVMGDEVRHYPDTLLLEIDGIRIRSFDLQGRLTTASAKRGVTNEDASEVQLMGNAVVVRAPYNGDSAKGTPRMEFRGEFLHAFKSSEKILSNKPVELIRGRDRFTADSLEFDNAAQILRLGGRVRGVLVPEVK